MAFNINDWQVVTTDRINLAPTVQENQQVIDETNTDIVQTIHQKGLNITSESLGFFDGTNWRAVINADGTFNFQNLDGTKFLKYDGNDFVFNGTVNFTNTDMSDYDNNNVETTTPQQVVDSINNGNTTTIDGGKITTGSITANKINTTGLIAENISGTTITGKTINGGVINSATINGGEINGINFSSESLRVKSTTTNNFGSLFADLHIAATSSNTSAAYSNPVRLYSPSYSSGYIKNRVTNMSSSTITLETYGSNVINYFFEYSAYTATGCWIWATSIEYSADGGEYNTLVPATYSTAGSVADVNYSGSIPISFTNYVDFRVKLTRMGFGSYYTASGGITQYFGLKLRLNNSY